MKLTITTRTGAHQMECYISDEGGQPQKPEEAEAEVRITYQASGQEATSHWSMFQILVQMLSKELSQPMNLGAYPTERQAPDPSMPTSEPKGPTPLVLGSIITVRNRLTHEVIDFEVLWHDREPAPEGGPSEDPKP